MVERSLRMREVLGSIPNASRTKARLRRRPERFLTLFAGNPHLRTSAAAAPAPRAPRHLLAPIYKAAQRGCARLSAAACARADIFTDSRPAGVAPTRARVNPRAPLPPRAAHLPECERALILRFWRRHGEMATPQIRACHVISRHAHGAAIMSPKRAPWPTGRPLVAPHPSRARQTARALCERGVSKLIHGLKIHESN